MGYMLPLWIRFPEIEMDSPAWRMGFGEEYIEKFHAWYRQLSSTERRRYDAEFPTPVLWSGYREGEKSCAKLRAKGFELPLWRNKGFPKYSVKHLLNQPDAQDICLFWGHHPQNDSTVGKSCLSQWWLSDFESYGVRYCCAEQYMMAQKARLFGDVQTLEKILTCDDPAQIKKLGRQVKRFEAQLWDRAKYSIALNGNWKKFSQNPELRQFLLSTGESVLAEASPYDKIWGIGLSAEQPQSLCPEQWRGENLLGFALMEVRDELKRVYAYEMEMDGS